jgi:hypothetical protein
VKFLDTNGNGIWEMGIDQPVNGVKLWLLAKTGEGRLVPADEPESPYYGKIKVIEEHGNPVLSGEGGQTLPGHYCFNLNVSESGVYEFYIWLDESTLPANYMVYPAIENKSLIINATLIGPIILETGDKEVSYDNNFANYLPPVGGFIVTPENKDFILETEHLLIIAGLTGIIFATTIIAIIALIRRRPRPFIFKFLK